MRLTTVIAISLAAISNVVAVEFNGFYKITSVSDGSALTLDSQSKVVSRSDAVTKSSVWYINSGVASGGFAFIANIRPNGVLNANNSYTSAGNDIDKSQALGSSFFSAAAANKTQQAWRINALTNSEFEIESAAFRGSLLDIRGDGTNTRQVLVYTRNNPISPNQKWRIDAFSLFDGKPEARSV